MAGEGEKGIYDLWREAQVMADMDSEVTVSGNGHSPFAVRQTLEYVMNAVGWGVPPRMMRVDRENYLRSKGRADEIEYLGAMGD